MAAGNDHDRAIWNDGYNQGKAAGRTEARKEVLTLLQEKFMNMTLPTSDPLMQATLVVAREISEKILPIIAVEAEDAAVG